MTATDPDSGESRQTFRIPPEVMARALRWGKEHGIVDRRGAAIQNQTVVTILERFLALEQGGQHVTALLDAHTDPVLERLEVLTRVLAYLLGALPVEWFNAADVDAGWQVVTNAQAIVQGGPHA